MPTQISQTNIIKATLLGFIAPVLWSIYPALSLASVGIPPLQLIATAFCFSFIFSGIILFLRKSSITETLKQPLKYWLIGIGGICGFNMFYIFAIQAGPPAEVFLIVVSWPIFNIILSRIILEEILRPWHIAGCFMGFSGIIFIAWQRGFSNFEPTHLRGYIAAFGASITWAIYSVLNRKYKEIPVDMVTVFCGATAFITIALHFSFEPTISITPHQLFLISIIGIGPTCLAYYAWNYGIRNGDIRVLSSIAFFGHFLAMSLLILNGHAEFTWQIAIAFTLIVGGAIIGSLGLFLKKPAKMSPS